MSLRVLITNNTLAHRAGSELYVRDLALALLRRGHTPIAFSTHLGEVAQELRAASVPVVDRLDEMAAPPDVIHGHHNFDLMLALLQFPGVPALCYSHGLIPWQEAPLHFPRIRRHVAVSRAVRDKLVFEDGIPEARIRVLLNFVDLDRFRPRAPLPAAPRRALVFSNNASAESYLGVVREACGNAGIMLDVMGSQSRNVCERPEEVLGDYDLVFGRGRCALEALAVGAAVVLCDIEGLGPMVTSADVERLRGLNMGLRALQQPVEPEALSREIGRYDPEDAARVSAWIRDSAGHETVIDEIIGLYREIIAEHAADADFDSRAEARAVSAYLSWLTPLLKDGSHLALQVQHLAADRDLLLAQNARLNQMNCELKSARAVLDAVGQSRVYRLMRLLGRWQLVGDYFSRLHGETSSGNRQRQIEKGGDAVDSATSLSDVY